MPKTMTKPRTALGGLVLTAAFGLTASPTLAADGTIGLSVSTLNNPFFVTLRDGAQEAAGRLGLDLVVVDAQDSVSKQVSDIEDLVTRGVEVLIVNPTDSDAVVPAVRGAIDAEIPVIAVDRGVNNVELSSFVVSDNAAGGVLAGTFICERIGAQGSVVELEGIPGVSATRDRGAGFNEAIAESCPEVEVVARQTANFNRAEGLSVMENILVAQPEIDALFAHNDEMALGALQAVESSGRDILVVGFDATDDAVGSVEDCRMGATVAQQPDQLGSQAVEIAQEIVTNGPPSEQTDVFVELRLVTNDACD